MSFESSSEKHRLMRDLLQELNVGSPERDYFYSTGSTVTAAGISAALQAVKEYKQNVRRSAQNLLDISAE